MPSSDDALMKRMTIGVTLLVAPIVWMLLEATTTTGPEEAVAGAGPSFAAPDPRPTPRAGEGRRPDDFESLLERVRGGTPAQLIITVRMLRLSELSDGSIDELLDEFDRRLGVDSDPTILALQVDLLRESLQLGAVGASRGRLLEQIRQRALTIGGSQLLARVCENLSASPRLLDATGSTPDGLDWLLDSAAVLRDADLLDEAVESRLLDPGAPFVATAQRARALLALVERSGDPEARQLLERLVPPGRLAQLPGGTPELGRRIEVWIGAMGAVLREEDRARRAPAGLTSKVRDEISDALEALKAVVRAPLPEATAERPLPTVIARQVDLDLLRAGLLLARLEERSGALTTAESGESRVRKLWRIGRNAIALQDAEELERAVELLRRSGAKSRADLLLQGLARSQGSEDAAAAIRDSLGRAGAAPVGALSLFPAEVIEWRRLAEQGSFSTLVDTPLLRFESGKRWAELGEDGAPWLERTIEDLRTRVESRESVLAYLEFLEARQGIALGRPADHRERLLALLDRGPPPCLSRTEIGALLILIEERSAELARAAEFRERITRAAGELAIDPSAPIDLAVAAELLRFHSAREVAPFVELGAPAVAAELAELVAALVEGRAVGFASTLGRLDLSELLRDAIPILRDEGESTLSLRLVDQVERLAGPQPELWRIRGELERSRAKALAATDPGIAREHWRAAGRAFEQVALADVRQTAANLDAARAMIEAGDLLRAHELAELADESEWVGRDESQRWESYILRAEIDRRLGRHLRVLTATTALLDEEVPRFPYEPILLIEQALARLALGQPEEAVSSLRRVVTTTDSTSPFWKRAVFEEARALEMVAARRDAPEGAAEAARGAWERAATWLSATGGERPADLAIARLRAGEMCHALGDLAMARTHLESLFVGADEFLGADHPPLRPERLRWSAAAEQARHALGDVYRAAGLPEMARMIYEEAIHRHPGSPRTPGGYLMLGLLAEERGETAEAAILYRRGLRKAEELGDALDEEPYHRVQEKLEARLLMIEAAG
ncbi:MAG: hypothetical protein ACO4CW_05150 [Planctomycetota bacterium]